MVKLWQHDIVDQAQMRNPRAAPEAVPDPSAQRVGMVGRQPPPVAAKHPDSSLQGRLQTAGGIGDRLLMFLVAGIDQDQISSAKAQINRQATHQNGGGEFQNRGLVHRLHHHA
jgi:hypothetical protein